MKGIHTVLAEWPLGSRVFYDSQDVGEVIGYVRQGSADGIAVLSLIVKDASGEQRVNPDRAFISRR